MFIKDYSPEQSIYKRGKKDNKKDENVNDDNVEENQTDNKATVDAEPEVVTTTKKKKKTTTTVDNTVAAVPTQEVNYYTYLPGYTTTTSSLPTPTSESKHHDDDDDDSHSTTKTTSIFPSSIETTSSTDGVSYLIDEGRVTTNNRSFYIGVGVSIIGFIIAVGLFIVGTKEYSKKRKDKIHITRKVQNSRMSLSLPPTPGLSSNSLLRPGSTIMDRRSSYNPSIYAGTHTLSPPMVYGYDANASFNSTLTDNSFYSNYSYNYNYGGYNNNNILSPTTTVGVQTSSSLDEDITQTKIEKDDSNSSGKESSIQNPPDIVVSPPNTESNTDSQNNEDNDAVLPENFDTNSNGSSSLPSITESNASTDSTSIKRRPSSLPHTSSNSQSITGDQEIVVKQRPLSYQQSSSSKKSSNSPSNPPLAPIIAVTPPESEVGESSIEESKVEESKN